MGGTGLLGHTRAWGKWGLGGGHLARVRVGCVVACDLGSLAAWSPKSQA